MDDHKEALQKLFFDTFNREVQHIIALEKSGSNRKYYRMQHGDFSAIGAYNEDEKENKAFLTLSRHFLGKNICVPTVYNADLSKNIYLISDLGNQTLYQRLCESRKEGDDFPKSLIDTYKQALDKLLDIQFSVGQDFDFSFCYPRAAFDKQSILWDLNYFKYYFLKLAHIQFDEQLLEIDFHTFADFLLEAKSSFFLYRDFQSRNIMISNDTLYFIDYQGGREGALQYDVASLLYDGKANIPQDIRELLLNHYVEQLHRKRSKEADDFKKYYYAFVFIRIMQAMGTYGFRGFYEQKRHFLQSIPYALKNLKWLLNNIQLPIEIPALWNVYHQLIKAKSLQQYGCPSPTLKISINSFSYKNTVPVDKSGHGGGFVFDCRCLPNPGRENKYKSLNGKDKEVIAFLNDKPEVNRFFEHITSIIDMAVQNYTDRQFHHLMVSFGCTGGQHRSVYFAERLQKYLHKNYSVDTELNHYNIEIK
ncbi:MAG: phosphotransferase [Bacteroidales bacterium]|jgi:aminoglycoside/choline kinase family phosphotransferase|nr:phosphotransferase [Bacteroidales bacterium]